MADSNKHTQQPSLPLAGATAIVTGASAGYGFGIARQLVAAGCTVLGTGRREERLRKACADSGAIPVVADASSPTDWDKVVNQAVEQCGRIDILVNNAGSGVQVGPFENLTAEQSKQILDSNLLSVVLGSRAVAPVMVKNGSGIIVNVSSVCAQYSWQGWSVYSAAKAGVERFTKSFYVEYREKGLRATTLTPSWGVTEFAHSAAIEGHPSTQPETQEQCTKPEELGDAVVHICATPAHLNLLEYTLIPTVQDFEPM